MGSSLPRRPQRSLIFLSVILVFLIFAFFFANTRFTRISSVSEAGILQVDRPTYYIAVAAISIFEAGLLYFAHRRCAIKPNWKMAIALSVLFVITTIGALSSVGIYKNGSLIYEFDWGDKCQFVFQGAMTAVAVYFLIVVIPGISKGRKAFDFILFLVSAFAFVGVIYSYISDFDYYRYLFAGASPDDGIISMPVSFADNRNLYGYLLICGTFAEGLLLLRKSRWYHWVFIAFYYAHCLLTVSKTCIIIGAFFIAAMIAYTLVSNVVRRRYIQALAPLCTFLVAGLLISLLCYVDMGSFNASIRSFLSGQSEVVQESFNGGTFYTRFNQFIEALDVVSSSIQTLLFGFGFMGGGAAYAAYAAGSPYIFATYDFSWGMNLLEGGVFGMVFSILSWIWLLWKVIMSIRKKVKYAWAYLAIYICFLARSFMEIADLTVLSWGGLAIYALLVCPLLSESKTDVEEVASDRGRQRLERPSAKTISALCLGAFYLFVVLPLCLFSGLSILGDGGFFSDKNNFALVLLDGAILFLGLYSLTVSCLGKKKLAGYLYSAVCLLDMLIFALGASSVIGSTPALYLSAVLEIGLLLIYVFLRGYEYASGDGIVIAIYLAICSFAIAVCMILFASFDSSVYLYFVEAVAGLSVAIWFCISLYIDVGAFPLLDYAFDAFDYLARCRRHSDGKAD